MSAIHKDMLRSGLRIAAELPAKRDGHRRFVTVKGLKTLPTRHPGYDAAPWQFRVSHYEVPERLLDEEPGPEHLADHRAELVLSVNDVDAAVARVAAAAAVDFSAAASSVAPY